MLVNNAAQDHTNLILETSDDEIDAVLAINLAAPIRVTREVAKLMVEQGTGGSIINLSSRLGTIGVATMGTYGAAKGGINAFTRHAAIELAQYAIRVNAIAPGLTETPLVAEWLAGQDDPRRSGSGSPRRSRRAASAHPTRWPGRSPGWPATSRRTSRAR